MPNINNIFLIASFDLTDSTIYKINKPDNWMGAFDNIRNFLIEKLSSKNFNLLKQIGDEWIIYCKIQQNSEDLIDKISLLIDLFEELRAEVLKLEPILNVKGAAWILPIVEDKGAFDSGYDKKEFNVLSFEMNKIYYSEDGKIFDFLGPHMGFRIAKNFTIKGLISSSFSLAYLVSQFDKPGKSFSLRYINNGFGFLKSVLRNNPYPKIYIRKAAFLDRLKEFTLTDIEMNVDINNIIREFYGKNYIVKFVKNIISNDFSNNSDDQVLILQKIIDEYKNRFPELKEEVENIKKYFNN